MRVGSCHWVIITSVLPTSLSVIGEWTVVMLGPVHATGTVSRHARASQDTGHSVSAAVSTLFTFKAPYGNEQMRLNGPLPDMQKESGFLKSVVSRDRVPVDF